ncbi:MAG: hypothetical protein ACPG3X_04825 [Opitutales bacterium]
MIKKANPRIKQEQLYLLKRPEHGAGPKKFAITKAQAIESQPESGSSPCASFFYYGAGK